MADGLVLQPMALSFQRAAYEVATETAMFVDLLMRVIANLDAIASAER